MQGSGYRPWKVGVQNWNKGPTRTGEALLPRKTEALTAQLLQEPGPALQRCQEKQQPGTSRAGKALVVGHSGALGPPRNDWLLRIV